MPVKETQKTHTQHAVPQNIMDVEFKLIGDLTMRQFAYLMIFGVVSYIAYVSGIPGFFKFIIILGSIGGGLAFAFLPIQDRGMDEWVINFINAVYLPTQKVWKKEPTPPSPFLYENISVLKQELITLAPTSSRRKLEQYLEIKGVEAKVDPLDLPEAEYIQKVREAFAERRPKASIALKEPKIEVEVIESKLEPLETEEKPKKPKEPGKEASKAEPSKEEEKPAPPEVEKEEKEREPKIIKHELKLPKSRVRERPLEPITPDRLPGRKFTHLAPEEGEIILPIRGERTLKTTEEAIVEEDIREKTRQLNELLEKIKTDEKYSVQLGQQVSQIQQELAQAPKPEPAISLPSDKITEEQPQEILKPEEQKNAKIERGDLEKQYSFLQKKIMELEEKVHQKELEKPKEDKPIQQAPPQEIRGVQPTYAKVQPISSKPNTISGIIKNLNSMGLEGILLIIKNNKGEAVRAIKTNSLGQFSITTPLSNGRYTVDVNVNNKSNLTFDIISIDARGDVIPPLEIIGK